MEKEFDLKWIEEGCGRNSPLWVEFCDKDSCSVTTVEIIAKLKTATAVT